MGEGQRAPEKIGLSGKGESEYTKGPNSKGGNPRAPLISAPALLCSLSVFQVFFIHFVFFLPTTALCVPLWTCLDVSPGGDTCTHVYSEICSHSIKKTFIMWENMNNKIMYFNILCILILKTRENALLTVVIFGKQGYK